MKKITFLCLVMLAFCWQSYAQDSCANALALTPGTPQAGDSAGQVGDFPNAGGAPENPCNANYNDDEYWFEYTATTDGEVLELTVTDITETWAGVFVLDDCPSGTPSCVAQDTNTTNGTEDLTVTTPGLTAGVSYKIVIANWGTPDNTAFTMNSVVIPPPACTAPTTGAITVDDSGCNPDGTGTFLVNIEVTDAGDAGSVFDDGTSTEPIVSGTVTMGPYNTGELVTIDIVALDPACSSNLVTDATFNCPAPGDTCADAIPVTEGAITGTTINAGSGGAVMTLTGTTDGVDARWFAYTATADGTINVNACGGGADTDLAVGTGACGAFTDVVVSDDACDLGDGNAWASEIDAYPVVAGEVYYIEWSNEWSVGPFDWSITFTPAPECEPAAFDAGTINDTCSNGTGTFTVDIFVEEVGDGGVFDDGTNMEPVVAGTVTMGPYNSGDSVTIEYVNGDVACDSTVGTFEFTCPPPPPANDEIAGAEELSVGDTTCESPLLASNVGATTSVENVNTADCTFAGGIPLGDVWYKVTVPSTGELTVATSTSGEITDTVMTIYRGTSGSLVEVGCDDDGGDGAFSIIALTGADGISPGDELLIRVWEYADDNKGTFNICAWSPTTLGIDDNTLGAFTYYPNPVNNTLTLNAQNTIEDVTLYNMLGQSVLRVTPNALNSEVDMSSLANGAYFVQVTIANTTKTVRVIKQ